MTTPKIEKWRICMDRPDITETIRNFGEWAYTNQYLPGRRVYGPKFIGEPIKQLKAEIGDIVAYITIEEEKAAEKQKENDLLRELIPLVNEILENGYMPININGIKDRIRTTLANIETLYVDDPAPHIDHTDTDLY